MASETSSAPHDRFCDLVMDGGITSGVVYPRAIHCLAQKYRFKNIGGTSAGAIAAVVTAAAEYQRREKNSMAGFDLLKGLPGQLGKTKRGSNKTFLFNLFQPEPSTERIFKVLEWSLNRTGRWRLIAAIGVGLMRAYWPALLGSILVALLIWLVPPLIADLGADGKKVLGAAAISICLLMSVILTLIWVYFDFTRRVVDNNYGLCTGMGVNDEGQESLTPWLHRLIQKAADLPLNEPLTFGKLWEVKGYPPDWLGTPVKTSINKSINLQLFTTSLSHGRPYVLPFEEEAPRFFYKKSELTRYLPKEVMQLFDSPARSPYLPRPGSDDPNPNLDEPLYELPTAHEFPVLLAVRMSLSFPLLFSAVPFWSIDHDDAVDEEGKKGTFKRCLFSDGGISSNFPIHLFDGLVPLWPTFGIALEPKQRTQGRLFLPEIYQQGYYERWNRFDQKDGMTDRFTGFIKTIVSTMQNWNDGALSRMPGVRDRVIRIRLEEQEGGMNLNMDPTLIKKMGDYGEDAATALINRFCGVGGAQSAQGWDEQRWIRLNVLLSMLEKQLPWLVAATQNGTPHTRNFSQMIVDATQVIAPGCNHPLDQAEAAELTRLLNQLVTFAQNFGNNLQSFKPIPGPELRVRPPL